MWLRRLYGRAPYGARGLKLHILSLIVKLRSSRPVWGAWIEIPELKFAPYIGSGRAPYGARGLKYAVLNVFLYVRKVAPRMGRVD